MYQKAKQPRKINTSSPSAMDKISFTAPRVQSIFTNPMLTNFRDTGEEYPDANDEWRLDPVKLDLENLVFPERDEARIRRRRVVPVGRGRTGAAICGLLVHDLQVAASFVALQEEPAQGQRRSVMLAQGQTGP